VIILTINQPKSNSARLYVIATMLIEPFNNHRSGIELVDLKMNEGRETETNKAPTSWASVKRI